MLKIREDEENKTERIEKLQHERLQKLAISSQEHDDRLQLCRQRAAEKTIEDAWKTEKALLDAQARAEKNATNAAADQNELSKAKKR